MAVKLSETDLPELLASLEPRQSLCFKVYGELKSHLKGLIPDLQFFVDRWPHPQAVVAREDLAGRQTMSIFGEISVCGIEDNALIGLLNDPCVVAWNRNVRFCVLPYSLKPVALAVAKEKGKAVTEIPVVTMKATPRDLKLLPIPEGLKVQPISDAEIKTIHSTWNHSHTVEETYIQNYVENYPSIFVVTENGDHVGHMVGSSYGIMGMLYVNPHFRGKGYAKVIVSQLSQMHFVRGEDAYVTIVEDHVSTQNLHKSVGFREVSDMKVMYVICR